MCLEEEEAEEEYRFKIIATNNFVRSRHYVSKLVVNLIRCQVANGKQRNANVLNSGSDAIYETNMRGQQRTKVKLVDSHI